MILIDLTIVVHLGIFCPVLPNHILGQSCKYLKDNLAYDGSFKSLKDHAKTYQDDLQELVLGCEYFN
jgi:hypothetical protein